MVLLSTAFLPPLSWMAAAARDSALSEDGVFTCDVGLEACETYAKQSWRNRCRILSASGAEDLSFPIVHNGRYGIGEVLVDYSTAWVLRLERALDAAYDSSPFFEYYRDDLFRILESRPERLWDLNLSLAAFLASKMGLSLRVHPTESFVPEGGAPDDFRFRIHPKRPDTVLPELGLGRPYWQVFAARGGFTPGLSAADLLFCEGPSAIEYVKTGLRP